MKTFIVQKVEGWIKYRKGSIVSIVQVAKKIGEIYIHWVGIKRARATHSATGRIFPFCSGQVALWQTGRTRLEQ